MDFEKWSEAALRITSEVRSVEEISDTLGLVPSSSYRLGEPVTERVQNAPRRQENVWLLKSTLDRSQPLEEHLRALLRLLFGKQAALEALSRSCELDLFCGYGCDGQGSVVLPASLLAELAALHIDLVLDVYAETFPVGGDIT